MDNKVGKIRIMLNQFFISYQLNWIDGNSDEPCLDL